MTCSCLIDILGAWRTPNNVWGLEERIIGGLPDGCFVVVWPDNQSFLDGKRGFKITPFEDMIDNG